MNISTILKEEIDELTKIMNKSYLIQSNRPTDTIFLH